MITGEVKSKVDAVWSAFWAGGVSNPLEVVEQLTYLLFLKGLDETHTAREARANRTGEPIQNPVFTDGMDQYRWKTFKDLAPQQMYSVLVDRIFPWMRTLGGEHSAFAKHMKDARFTLPPEKAGVLARVVDGLDKIPMQDRDTKGDLYEYLLSKLSSAGQNGQFRTPRHIINMMVEVMRPTPQDTICDPACGTAGFLVGSEEYLRARYEHDIYSDPALKQHFENAAFHGFDFDHTMLRVAAMNMLLHGVPNPDIRNKDSLSSDHGEDSELYSLILANPPFKGSLDESSVAKDLTSIVKTKKTELLFLALFLRLLKTGGRAAVIVPDGVLFGSSKAHKQIRETIVEHHKLEGIISLPSGVFRPYAGVSTAIMIFTKTGRGGTGDVWFYDMKADGFTLDDKRNPTSENDIPDIIHRWHQRDEEQARQRTDQSFFVPKADIVANGYDLSINRYKETQHEAVEYDKPEKILDDLDALEGEIQAGLKRLREMLA
ncbi:type I restriction-modification system subunit M [Deinococcus arcticus]|uniref:site-specific DNA-methyltransferase (adenine-specific) n=1 Tax=Deinococcus arcticus TaxID=2136176 RepID=A0A2T3W9Y5_9DEIO|nr:class I SAM-dependent DNA methyltransferase [Deinococcus arcticus]PTA68604.1 hypothetical protein C8263_07380 [Deinococcus arcticus]